MKFCVSSSVNCTLAEKKCFSRNLPKRLCPGFGTGIWKWWKNSLKPSVTLWTLCGSVPSLYIRHILRPLCPCGTLSTPWKRTWSKMTIFLQWLNFPNSSRDWLIHPTNSLEFLLCANAATSPGGWKVWGPWPVFKPTVQQRRQGSKELEDPVVRLTMLQMPGDQLKGGYHGEVKEMKAQNGFWEEVTPVWTLKNTKELAKCLRQKVQPAEMCRSEEGDASQGCCPAHNVAEETGLGSDAGFCHPCPCAKSLILGPWAHLSPGGICMWGSL